tara:strand:- start:1275 stop:1496 length:222 start_codon:yes stop_codon:yes gene_type:complete
MFLGIRVICQILMFVAVNIVNEIGLRIIRLKNALPNSNKIPIKIIDLTRGSALYRNIDSSIENEEEDNGSPTE